MQEIILASKSPRRKQLLEWAEVPFRILAADTDESFPSSLDPASAAIHVAVQKAEAIAETAASSIILAADTMVVLGDEIIGKPVDRNNAIEILTALAGREHRVITGVAIKKGTELKSFADVTEVAFHPLTREQIEFYVDKYKPYDKAGAYAIQEWIGVTGIKWIRGDFYNVMGLPVSRVLQTLREF